MKKVTFLLLGIWMTCSLHAQFTFFDESIDPQKGGFAVGDINGDGLLDVIFNGVDIQGGAHIPKGAIMINNGDGTFSRHTGENPIVTGQYTCIKFGDINGDGHLDIIYCGHIADNVTHVAGIALNDGNGNFTYASQYPMIEGERFSSCGFADFDNDGLLDYYIFGNGLNKGALFFQEKDGSFTKHDAPFAAYHFVDPEVSIVDFNNDGFLDIFISAYNEVSMEPEEAAGRFCGTFRNDYGMRKFVLYNQTVFNYKSSEFIAKSAGSSFWADIDGNGFPDLVLNGDGWVNTTEKDDNIVRIFKNANGTLVPATTFTQFRQLSVGGGSILGDWDNDGKLDLITGGWNETKKRQTTSLYLGNNTSGFTFTESPLSDNFFPGVSENTYELADLNNDGKVDLLIMGFNGAQANQVGKYDKNICGYCLNTTATAGSKPATPGSLSCTTKTVEGELETTFSWSASSSEAGKMGTTYQLALKNKSTGKWLYHPMGIIDGEKNGQRMSTGKGNVEGHNSWTLYNLPEAHYEWTVQTINGAFIGGAFAPIQTFTVGNPSSIANQPVWKPSIYTSQGKLHIKKEGLDDAASFRIITIAGNTFSEENVVTDVEKYLPQGIYIVEIKSSTNVYKTKVAIN